MCLLQSLTHRDGSLTVCRYSLGSLKVWTSVISPGGTINLGRLGCPLCPAQKFLILNERHGRHTEWMVPEYSSLKMRKYMRLLALGSSNLDSSLAFGTCKRGDICFLSL